MVRVWFPNFYMRLINVATNSTPIQATFKIPPRMTKTEVKEYLTKIYDLPISKVDTMNYLGKWKRFWGAKRVISYKRRNYKKAVVTFSDDYKPSAAILTKFPPKSATAQVNQE